MTDWAGRTTVVVGASDGSGPKEGTPVSTFDGAAGGPNSEPSTRTRSALRRTESMSARRARCRSPASPRFACCASSGPQSAGACSSTGASGGVGRFAVQLAHRAGAYVIASVGSPARGEGLRELGADEVVVDLEDITAEVDGVIETVGGAVLGRAFSLLARGGSLQSVGMASLAPSTIDLEAERFRPDRRIEVFNAGNQFGMDLTFLLGLLAKQQLDPQIGWRGSWEHASEAADALFERRVKGKAVLDLR